MSYQKRTALALATAVAGSVVLITAPQAQASVVDVNYNCQTPIGAKSAVSPIDIKAVKSGSSYKVTMSFQKGVSSSPVALGSGAMNPSAVINLGGADKGTVSVTGPANSAEIPANTPIKISDLSGSYVPKANGKVTFTAADPHHQGAGHHHDLHSRQQPRPLPGTGRHRRERVRRAVPAARPPSPRPAPSTRPSPSARSAAPWSWSARPECCG